MIGDVLSNFSFSAQWNGGVFYFAFLTIVCYLFIIPTPTNHTKGKSFLFVFAILLLAFTLGGPLNIVARMIFRAHIIQMVILFFIVAPMVVIGAKRGGVITKLALPYINSWPITIKHPVIAILLFQGLLIVYHIPSVFDYIRMSTTLNYLYLFCLFMASIFLYFTLFTYSDRSKSFSCHHKWIYVILNMIILLGFSCFLVMTKNQLFDIYNNLELLQTALAVCLPAGETIEDIPAEFFDVLNPFPPFQEQKIGGAILAGSQLLTLLLFYSVRILKGR